jgi:RsmE family RNA methyltransferase
MQRFYLPEDLSLKTLKLENEEINYQLQKVLRAGVGDQVIFFDGIDFEDRIFEIVQIEKRHILFTFIKKQKKQKNNFSLELYQSLPNKIEKMEMILQKGVEV